MPYRIHRDIAAFANERPRYGVKLAIERSRGERQPWQSWTTHHQAIEYEMDPVVADRPYNPVFKITE
jgi:hypothetical protein